MTAPLTLLHGWGSSPAVWSPMCAALAPEIDTLALNLPGHGMAPDAPPELDCWVELILNQLPPRTTLCGWSLGAVLALRIAHRAPGRIERLVLIGASPCFVRHEEWPCGLAPDDVERFQQAFEREPESLQKRFRALQALNDRQRRTVLDALEQTRAPHAELAQPGMAGGLEILRKSDLRAQLADLALPVRVLHGAGDALMPVEAAVALADALPDARLSVFEDCAHAPHLSRPSDCALLIQGFLDG